MNKSKEVLKMFKAVLNGTTDVWDFSFDFGEWLAYEDGDLLIEENEPLFDLLNDNIVDMLEELEDYTLETNHPWLMEYYEKAKQLVPDEANLS